MVGHKFVADFVADFVAGAFLVNWKKSLKFHKKSKVDVVAGKRRLSFWTAIDSYILDFS